MIEPQQNPVKPPETVYVKPIEDGPHFNLLLHGKRGLGQFASGLIEQNLAFKRTILRGHPNLTASKFCALFSVIDSTLLRVFAGPIRVVRRALQNTASPLDIAESRLSFEAVARD